jgi:hypothetical protein
MTALVTMDADTEAMLAARRFASVQMSGLRMGRFALKAARDALNLVAETLQLAIVASGFSRSCSTP